ncbi:MAG TPA: hypothetical protein VM219_05710 [Phycisphaerae bacterium]|nr:hypothetical protein [Phycisphaerae bacterium]
MRCFVCRRDITESEPGTSFHCDRCGFSGTIHDACLGEPSSAVGGFGPDLRFLSGIVWVHNICPRCKEMFSKPVEGVEEAVIDEIIAWLDVMDEVDHLPLPVTEKVSTPEWTAALAGLAEIGNAIDKKGGLDLMQKAFSRVHNKSGRRGSYLDRAWNGIGQWQA